MGLSVSPKWGLQTISAFMTRQWMSSDTFPSSTSSFSLLVLHLYSVVLGLVPSDSQHSSFKWSFPHPPFSSLLISSHLPFSLSDHRIPGWGPGCPEQTADPAAPADSGGPGKQSDWSLTHRVEVGGRGSSDTASDYRGLLSDRELHMQISRSDLGLVSIARGCPGNCFWYW